MRLDRLLDGLDYTLVTGSIGIEIDDIVYDSRCQTLGCVYVGISDSADYIITALNKGAKAIVVTRCAWECLSELTDATVCIVDDTRHALAIMSGSFFEHPEKKLKIIGITGTKGKTTTAYMLHTILATHGFKVGLIGTIETLFNEEWYPQDNTTPESYKLYEIFSKMVLSGIEIVIMEVSSQALKQHRCDGITFDVGVFTNISLDHIGGKEHESFEEYLDCKSRLFRQCRLALLNKDDNYSEYMKSIATCDTRFFSVDGDANYTARDITLYKEKQLECVSYMFCGPLCFNIKLGTPGIFNVYNSLCALSIATMFDINPELSQKAIYNTRIKGRMEIVPTMYPFTIIIDYAHNEIALRSLLTGLRESAPKRLICCFGCGGNRDKRRRFSMGKVSGELADVTLVTSDNPRNENPCDIIEDITEGIKKVNGVYMVIPDRKEAIKYAIQMGKPGDIIVLAGKGHEDYQDIDGKHIPMNERFIIRDLQKGKIIDVR